MSLAPILLFVYNRPDHARRAIESLQANTLAAQSELFIYADAAANPEASVAVDEVHTLINHVEGFAAVHTVLRERNYGLAANIIDGVTNLTRRYGRVIVVEDDLVVAPYFLQFMNDALDVYADEHRVGHIQACDFTQDPSLPDTFLIKFTGSWGWATWERAWRHFNPDGRALLQQMKERGLCHRFDFNGRYRFTRMLRRQTEGKNNSWAIRWNASLFLDDILSLNVGRSLVSNIGFDGSGTHSRTGDPYTSKLFMQRLPVVRIEPIQENLEARKAFERYYARTNSFWARARRRLKQLLTF